MTSEVPAVADLGRVHLVGVGGAGMSVVATLLAARGVEVSGSDARSGPALDALAASGVRVHVGHAAAHVDGADTVVLSTAIREQNPEAAAARAHGLRVMHRSEALAALMRGRVTVAVAGAHGKTTTSAMIAVTLTAAGLDPSYAIGGTVLASASGAVGGAHHGAGEVFVAEADESDGSFLAYSPTVAVVTNVEADHLDHYGSVEAFEQAFLGFCERIVPDGHLVVCADDPGAARLAAGARGAGVRVLTYGTSDDADVRLTGWAPVTPSGTGAVPGRAAGGGPVAAATVLAGDDEPVRLELTVPGVHNALNATAAWATARVLGVDGRTAARGLAQFAGTARRFEDRGSVGGVRVVDDYAHHPTEVAALLRAARSVAGTGRVLVLFQPHLYSRTAAFAGEFAAALGLADCVVVTDVYGAREDPDPEVSGALITDRMSGAADARFVPDRLEAARAVGGAARSGDLVLTVGAGDVTELAPHVLAAVP